MTGLDTIDLLISFDTTGSMYPCLTQVRRLIAEVTKKLFKQIADLRIGIIAHGDYCDGDRCISKLLLTDDEKKICDFVKTVPPTGGGDVDECYELSLNVARSFNWTSGRNKALIIIGDANPHPIGYSCGGIRNTLDWLNEAKLLVEAGISIYPIQALGRSSSDRFYNHLAKLSGTPKLELPQFADIVDIVAAIFYKQAGQFDLFEQDVKARPIQPSYHVLQTLDLLAGRKLSRRSVKIGSRFQVLEVPEKTDIKGFVVNNGLDFKKGRGFYQFTKSETIQDYKEVVAQNNETGAIIEGTKARKALNLPLETVNAKPEKGSKYTGFIQSTSVNRALIGGTKFLYEVADCADLSA